MTSEHTCQAQAKVLLEVLCPACSVHDARGKRQWRQWRQWCGRQQAAGDYCSCPCAYLIPFCPASCHLRMYIHSTRWTPRRTIRSAWRCRPTSPLFPTYPPKLPHLALWLCRKCGAMATHPTSPWLVTTLLFSPGSIYGALTTIGITAPLYAHYTG